MDYSLLLGVHVFSPETQHSMPLTNLSLSQKKLIYFLFLLLLSSTFFAEYHTEHGYVHLPPSRTPLTSHNFFASHLSRNSRNSRNSRILPFRRDTDTTSQNRWRFGVMSRDESELYFMGIIDILQFFNWSKKIEYFLKTRILLRDSVCPQKTKEKKEERRKGGVVDRILVSVVCESKLIHDSLVSYPPLKHSTKER